MNEHTGKCLDIAVATRRRSLRDLFLSPLLPLSPKVSSSAQPKDRFEHTLKLVSVHWISNRVKEGMVGSLLYNSYKMLSDSPAKSDHNDMY